MSRVGNDRVWELDRGGGEAEGKCPGGSAGGGGSAWYHRQQFHIYIYSLVTFLRTALFFQRVTLAASSLSIISLNRSSMSSDLCTVSILTYSIPLCSTAMSLVGSNSLQALQRCVHYTPFIH